MYRWIALSGQYTVKRITAFVKKRKRKKEIKLIVNSLIESIPQFDIIWNYVQIQNHFHLLSSHPNTHHLHTLLAERLWPVACACKSMRFIYIVTLNMHIHAIDNNTQKHGVWRRCCLGLVWVWSVKNRRTVRSGLSNSSSWENMQPTSRPGWGRLLNTGQFSVCLPSPELCQVRLSLPLWCSLLGFRCVPAPVRQTTAVWPCYFLSLVHNLSFHPSVFSRSPLSLSLCPSRTTLQFADSSLLFSPVLILLRSFFVRRSPLSSSPALPAACSPCYVVCLPTSSPLHSLPSLSVSALSLAACFFFSLSVYK